MSATYRPRGKKKKPDGTRSWLITVHAHGQKAFKTIRGTEQDAKDLVKEITKTEILGTNVIDAIRTARAASPKTTPTYPNLRDALAAFVDSREMLGDIRESSARAYRSRLGRWLYDHTLTDGRVLGHLPIDQVTRDMLGRVLLAMRAQGISASARRHVCYPVKAFYADLIETHRYKGTNPRRRSALLHGQGVEQTHEESTGVHARRNARPPRDDAGRVPALVSVRDDGHPRRAAMGRNRCAQDDRPRLEAVPPAR